MARKKGKAQTVAQPAEAAGQAQDQATGNKGLSRVDAVARALAALGNDALPEAIVKYAKKHFGMRLEHRRVSDFKYYVLKKQGLKGKRKGRRGGRPKAAAAAPNNQVQASGDAGISKQEAIGRVLAKHG